MMFTVVVFIDFLKVEIPQTPAWIVYVELYRWTAIILTGSQLFKFRKDIIKLFK